MLKYKEWKQLNESFMGSPSVLGMGQPTNLGVTGSFGLAELEAIEEAAKKKKMLGDMPFKKKKVLDDEEDLDLDKEKVDDDEEELDHDEDKETHDEPDEDDEDLGDEDLGGGEKKKKKVIDLGDEPMFAKKGGKGKKDCKKGKCESTIDDEETWWNSVKGQLSADPNKRYSDGTEYLNVKEDAIVPPGDPNSQLVTDEPAPGDVGFAPQNRVGGTNPVGNWAGFSEIGHVEQAIR